MVNIDSKIQPLTFGKKKKILGLIPGSRMIEKIINNIFFEIDSSNKVLWLYKP
jgi:protease-4